MRARQLVLLSAAGSHIWWAIRCHELPGERWSAELIPTGAVISRLAMNHGSQEVFWES
jgi:hypothetical protein